jgi:hypothetical protein
MLFDIVYIYVSPHAGTSPVLALGTLCWHLTVQCWHWTFPFEHLSLNPNHNLAQCQHGVGARMRSNRYAHGCLKIDQSHSYYLRISHS